MPETWMDLLNRIGVFAENNAEMCHWCKKVEGTVQLYGLNRHGERVPAYKLCSSCYVVFKTPSPWLQKRRKRRGIL